MYWNYHLQRKKINIMRNKAISIIKDAALGYLTIDDIIKEHELSDEVAELLHSQNEINVVLLAAVLEDKHGFLNWWLGDANCAMDGCVDAITVFLDGVEYIIECPEDLYEIIELGKDLPVQDEYSSL